MPTPLTARKIFQYAWSILDTTATHTNGSAIGDPWEQLMQDRVHDNEPYADTVLRIARLVIGDEKDAEAGVQITIPSETPGMEYLVFTATMPVRTRKNALGAPERTHGFAVQLFAPGPWCAHIESVGKRAQALLKDRTRRAAPVG
jgi:hypothetical protein